MIFFKYTLRNLIRNPRRTLLSVASIGIGCAMALVITSFMRGRDELFARTASETGSGHLRIVPKGWRLKKDPAMRLALPEKALTAVQTISGIHLVAPHTRAQALLALGNHVAGVEIAGVDPRKEPGIFRIMRNPVQGRYLSGDSSDEMILGESLAQRLKAQLDDQVLVTAVGKNGEMRSAMFRLIGIVTSGSREIDSGICQVPIQAVQDLTGVPGFGEIALLLRDYRELGKVKARVQAALPAEDEVLSWEEITPDLAIHLKQDAAMYQLLNLIVAFLIVLSITSSQLTAVLERRKELAILSAIGMRPLRTGMQIFLEALLLAVLGGGAATLLAAPLILRYSRKGLDLSKLYSGKMVVEGVLFEPKLYADFGIWILASGFGIALSATLLSSLYPSWFAGRTDPAQALRAAA